MILGLLVQDQWTLWPPTYTCTTGYTLNGGNNRTCGSDGVGQLQCVRVSRIYVLFAFVKYFQIMQQKNGAFAI